MIPSSLKSVIFRRSLLVAVIAACGIAMPSHVHAQAGEEQDVRESKATLEETYNFIIKMNSQHGGNIRGMPITGFQWRIDPVKPACDLKITARVPDSQEISEFSMMAITRVSQSPLNNIMVRLDGRFRLQRSGSEIDWYDGPEEQLTFWYDSPSIAERVANAFAHARHLCVGSDADYPF